MQTSGEFTIRAKDAFSYRVLDAIYSVLPHYGSRIRREERLLLEGECGDLTDPISDVRAIRYILSKYGISNVGFAIHGLEDRGYNGYMGLFDIWYVDGEAFMCDEDIALYGEEDEEDPEDCEDLTFVITGKLSYFENREEFVEYIEDLGGRVTGSISKKTDYLINNDPTSDSSKNRKAKELGIPVITEAEFRRRFGGEADEDESVRAELQESETYFLTAPMEELLSNQYGEEISDDAFFAGIWSIDDFEEADVDELDEKLREALKKAGVLA